MTTTKTPQEIRILPGRTPDGEPVCATITTKDGYLSITGETNGSSGYIHDEILAAFPGLDWLIPLHLSDVPSGVPMHAAANSLYHARAGDFTAAARTLRHPDPDEICAVLTSLERRAAEEYPEEPIPTNNPTSEDLARLRRLNDERAALQTKRTVELWEEWTRTLRPRWASEMARALNWLDFDDPEPCPNLRDDDDDPGEDLPTPEMIAERLAADGYALTYTTDNAGDLDRPARFTVTLTRRGQSLTTPYSKGAAHRRWKKRAPRRDFPDARPGARIPQRLFMTRRTPHLDEIANTYTEPIPPTLDEVMRALTLDASTVRHGQSFDDWCADFGSDPDSITARESYNACTENWRALTRLGADFDALDHLFRNY